MKMSVHAAAGSLDIEEEYKNTLRARSNARFLSKKQRPEEEMEAFLDTQQDQDDFIITSLMLQNQNTAVLIRRRRGSGGAAPSPSEVELALADYFEASAEALDMCRQLLRNVKSAQSNCRSMDSFLAAMAAAADDVTAAALFPVRSNPFFTTTRSNFRQIHDRCSAILQSIRSSRGRVARKLRIVKAVKNLAAAAAAIGAAPYLLFLIGLLIGPAAAAGLCRQIALMRRRPVTATKQGRSGSGGKTTTVAALSLVQDQLDAAAKGTYVLGRDLDTVNQLVARLSDGIERENAMAWRCVEAAAAGDGDRWCPAAVVEMVSELRRSCSASGRLAEELKEHVCLCLATIHKARVLVIHDISKKA